LSFSIFTQDEIKKLSEVKITTPLSFNALGHPLKGGLYDPALGVYISQN
jgi:DNA-directed RNA polymerase I subunit RPA1